MGIIDKVMFWKKKEEDFSDLGIGDDFGLGKDLTGMEGIGKNAGDMPGFGDVEHSEGFDKPLTSSPKSPQTPEIPGYDTPMPPTYNSPMPQRNNEQLMIGKELELISTKLDSLKITMDNMNMRIASLERIARGDYEKSW